MGFLTKIVRNALPYCLAEYMGSRNIIPVCPGGYSSPIASKKDIKQYNFNAPLPETLPGIDLNTNEQMDLLNSFESFYKELPFSDEKTEGLRYYYKNSWFGYSDAILLYCMLRHLNPKKIIEVGSGFSSSVILDTNELFLENSINCTFIDPYSQRLESLLNNRDKQNVEIHKKKVQEVSKEVFQKLGKNDILFIDSSHISKFNSDVNYLIHQILPELADGVYIHIHDVVYPFEYSKRHILNGDNEAYILRAFLQYNKVFKIVMFHSYLKRMYTTEIKNRFPLLSQYSGGSIWLKKTM